MNRTEIIEKHKKNGVSFVDEANAYIDEEVTIGGGTGEEESLLGSIGDQANDPDLFERVKAAAASRRTACPPGGSAPRPASAGRKAPESSRRSFLWKSRERRPSAPDFPGRSGWPLRRSPAGKRR